MSTSSISLATTLFFLHACNAAQVRLAWDPVPCDYYILLRGPRSGYYDSKTVIQKDKVEFVVKSLRRKKTYFFVIKSSFSGLLSLPSNEVKHPIP